MNRTDLDREIISNAIDSFVYFTLGITIDRKDGVLESIIRKAYTDATQQGAFNIPVSKLREVSQKDKEYAQKQTIDYLKKEIENYRKKNCREEFKAWHRIRCLGIIEQHKGINQKSETYVFSYGNAQKLLNMTLKYIYLLGSLMDFTTADKCFSKIASNVLADEQYLDIPIDRIVMK